MDFQETSNKEQENSTTQQKNPESAKNSDKNAETSKDIQDTIAEIEAIHDPPTTNLGEPEAVGQGRATQIDENMNTDDSSDVSLLPLDKKKALLDSYNYIQYLKEGSYVDAVDTTNTFIFAKVFKIEELPGKGFQLCLGFDGWSEKWHIVKVVPSRYVAPFRTNHKGYSGQQKVAIRNDLSYNIEDIRKHRQQIEKLITLNFEETTPNEITQYVRGQMFVYVDYLMGLDLPLQDLDLVDDLIRSVLRLIAVWLKKIPTLTKAMDELQKIPNLFLVDPHCAIIECYHELMETLNKIFCNCRRAYRFFCFFDEDQERPAAISKEVDHAGHQIILNTYGAVVLDQTERDFKGQNLEDDTQYSPELSYQRVVNRSRNEFGRLLNWVQYFADIGGFNGIQNVLGLNLDKEDDSPKIPFNIASMLLKPFRNLNNTLTPEFAKAFSGQCRDLIVRRLSTMNDKDVKNCDKTQIDSVLKDLSSLVLIGHTQQEMSQLKETTLLSVALRFLKSSYLEKRLKGLQDIKDMIEKVSKQERANLNRKAHDQTGIRKMMTDSVEYDTVEKAEFFTGKMMCEWFVTNKVIEIIFGEGSHIEIVKRSASVLKMLARFGQGVFDQSTVDLIWRCQTGKHEEMVRTVYEVIVSILSSLSQDLIDMFFAKVKQTQLCDEKFLMFLKKFTDIALDRDYYTMKNRFAKEAEEREEDDIDNNYDNYLIAQETQQILNIGKLVQETKLGDSQHYGLPIFWQICLNSKLNKEISILALKLLLEILTAEEGHRKHNRMTYLALGVSQLIANQNLVPSAQLSKHIIDSVNKDISLRLRYSNNEPSLIQNLQGQLKIVDILVANLSTYSNLVQQQLKVIQEVGSYGDQVFVGGYSHEVTIQTYLDLLAFIVGDTHVQIGIDNIKVLWQLFIDKPNYQQDQNLFLHWINRSSKVENNNQQVEVVEVFTPNEKKFLFTEILCPFAHAKKENINFGLATCFQSYFKAINIQEGSIHNERKRMRVVNFQQLQGMAALWAIAINQTKRDVCQELLVDLHLKILNRDQAEEIKKIFIIRCMEEMRDSVGVINLLSIFLDKYEGKQLQAKETGNNNFQYLSSIMKPTKIQVNNWLDPQECQVAHCEIFNHYTLGQIRAWIANEFGLQINEFIMIIKNQIIDAELNDDTRVADLNGGISFFSQVSIKRNQNYSPELHPKFAISNNQAYFDNIFSMLKSTESPQRIESVWSLITKLPVNQARKDNLKHLDLVRQTTDKAAAWNQLLDTSTLFKLLYSLKIIEEFTKDEQWVNEFINLQGFNHLLSCLVNQQINQFNSQLELSCINQLVAVINSMISHTDVLLGGCDVKLLLTKLVQFIDMVCQFSVVAQQQRGESINDIRVRMQNSKMPNSEDKKMYDTLIRNFTEQSSLIKQVFLLMNYLNNAGHYFLCLEVISAYPHLTRVLSFGLLESENSQINQSVGIPILNLLNFRYDGTSGFLKTQILQIELCQILPQVEKYSNHCTEFFNQVCNQIQQIKPTEVEAFKPLALQKISELASLIITREIIERTREDTDYLLRGYMNLLANLLQLYPHVKLDCGQAMASHLIHECLFEIPHGTKGEQGQSAPKCKNPDTRKYAFILLNVLCRDCLENLQTVLSYLKSFSANTSWRTNKESDWDVQLFKDEKSTTGHVGIKNLGCICYMNSLNQQLFMIPSFRNDVLSIRDPNHKKDTSEDNMFLQWQTLFSGLLLSQKMYVNPKSYCHAFKDWDGNPTNVLEQMDVEEYLNMFLDRLETAIKGTPQEKTIQYHFGGCFANEIICQSCNYTYNRPEQFLSLGVSVKNKKSVFEGLDAFIEGDMLEADNQYFCERCNCKVDAHKRTCIKRLPKYLIMTLKRFEFDFDNMIRIKVNDYFEFPLELDMSKYTQEYLQKAAKGGEIVLNFPQDYYNFELVGVVVHSGTADSGHYYSFIKEQEKFDFDQPEKWFEFNDIFVSPFNSKDIQKQCFGGEETYNYGWNHQSKVAITKNAYLLVYKRKLEDFNDEEEEIDKSKAVVSLCGQKTLNMDPESHIYKKVANSNHKYWQNRYLFGDECADFVKQLVLHWNTNYVIPAQTSWRNNDIHLTEPIFRQFSENASRPLSIQAVRDLKINLVIKYTPEQVLACQLDVFKFAASFYYTVCQRAYNKAPLQEMVRYLKAYMNYDSQCAAWFLQQFVNFDIIKECFLESPPHPSQAMFMRQIMVGLIYCAMLKLYETERKDLNNYWADLKANKQQCRQTTLGNLILVVITTLPTFIHHYNKNQVELLQILYRFSNLGPEARLFLLEAHTVERLLNFFHYEPSPYKEEFLNEKKLPFDTNQLPEIGLPTKEDPKAQKSRYQLIRQQKRINVLFVKNPKYHFLAEILSNLVCTINVGTPTPYMLEDSGYQLTEHDQVLFLPSYEFLEKLFVSCQKPRAMAALCKAYIHNAWNSPDLIQKLWETVKFGLGEYCGKRSRPFFLMFQLMLQAANDGNQNFICHIDEWMCDFLQKIVPENSRFFAWMETAIDFLFKFYSRIPMIRQWLIANPESWEFINNWNDKNREPPAVEINSKNKQYLVLYKPGDLSQKQKDNEIRFNPNKNKVLYYYRHTTLGLMRSGSQLDLSQEIDYDMLDLTDIKFAPGQAIDILEQKTVPWINITKGTCTVITELDECLQFADSRKKEEWVLSNRGQVVPADLLQNIHKVREMKRIETILNQKAQLEAQQRQQQMLQKQQEQQKANWYQKNREGLSDEEDDEDEEDEMDVDVQENGIGAQQPKRRNEHTHGTESGRASEPDKTKQEDHNNSFEAQHDGANNSVGAEFDVDMAQNISEDVDLDSMSDRNISD